MFSGYIYRESININNAKLLSYYLYNNDKYSNIKIYKIKGEY